jgi:hypothetical protein
MLLEIQVHMAVLFSQDTVPQATLKHLTANGTVFWEKISFKRFFFVAHVVEHHLHIPEWYQTPKSDF